MLPTLLIKCGYDSIDSFLRFSSKLKQHNWTLRKLEVVGAFFQCSVSVILAGGQRYYAEQTIENNKMCTQVWREREGERATIHIKTIHQMTPWRYSVAM